MNNFLEKLKNINYKSKKAVICYIVAGAVLISGTGIGIALYVNNNTNSDSIVEQSNTKEKEENKKSDKNKVDDKKDTSTKTNDKKEDKSHKVEKDKDNKKEDSKKSDKNKTDDKKPTSNKTDNNKNIVTTNTNNKKPTSNNTISNSNNNKPTSPSEPSRPQTQPEQPTPPVHQHSWVPDVEYIKHGEVYHIENKPIYGEGRWAEICKICGDEINLKNESPAKHNKDHMMNGETGPNGEGGSYTKWVQDIIGYEPVKVVDKEEWTETITKGEKCSTCGARK